jgi:DNA-binding IclR family transcriptional regulator
MVSSDLPDGLQHLVNQHLFTMDHVAVVLELREHAERTESPDELARTCRLEPAVVERVIRDLTHSRLIRPEGDGVRYDAAPGVRTAVDALAEMNRRKPVTLVRAIYARPPRAVQSFADAFRLRKPGE